MLKQNQDNKKISIKKRMKYIMDKNFAVMETVVSRSSFQRF